MVALVSAQRARSLIAALSRDVPDFPSPGVLFRDLTPVLADAAGFDAVVLDRVRAVVGAVGDLADAHRELLVIDLERAIERPSDVLPTPGGPTRHRIGPFMCETSACTARYSRMRSLTLSRP